MTLTQVQESVGIGGISLVALGANLPSAVGSPLETLQSAIEDLDGADILLVARSRAFVTPCVPKGAGPDYVNAAVAIRSALSSPALLARLHAVEARFGRSRNERWGARSLDLDLIAQGDTVLPDAATWAEWAALQGAERLGRTPDRLILPHPRLAERAFVLVPLAEVAPPGWRHPVTRQTVAQMLAALPPADVAAIRPLQGGPAPSPRL